MKQNVEMFDDEQMTEEEVKTETINNEDELLRALTSGDIHADMTERIEVRLGKVAFSFRIRPLSEKEWDRCREQNTRYQRNKRLGGMKLPESTNTTGYHSSLIYTATVDEDKKRLWDNKKFWDAVNAVTGTDLVDKLIPLAGKKQAIVDRIEALSGYSDEDEEAYNETIKN